MKKTRIILALFFALVFVLQVPAMAFTLNSANQDITETESDTSATDSENAEVSVAQFENTKIFVQWLDQEGIEYSLHGVDDDGFEKLDVNYIDSNGNTNYYFMVFYQDNELTTIYNWYVIKYDVANLNDVLYTCNDINSSYRYVKFYCDESDNTVTSQIDVILRQGDTVLPMLQEGMETLSRITGYGYEELSQYDTY